MKSTKANGFWSLLTIANMQNPLIPLFDINLKNAFTLSYLFLNIN